MVIIKEKLKPFQLGLLVLSVFFLSATGCSSIESTKENISPTTTGGGGVIGTGTGKATLSWSKPDKNADGSDLEGIVDFRIYYGITTPLSKNNSQILDVAQVTEYTLSGLESGTYYFAITALDQSLNESALSGEVRKVISE